MKKIVKILIMIAFMMAANSAMADYSLSIFHFNDFHSRFEPINKYDSNCSQKQNAVGKCFGGIARIKSMLDKRRKILAKEGQDSILVIAGDAFQGSLFYTKYKGRATASFFNSLNIDGFALGNHEFDDGPSVLSDFLSRVNFPVLGGNVDVSAEPLLVGKIPGIEIVNKGNERLALIGIVTPYTANISSPGKNISFIDNRTYLNSVIPQLQTQGINRIIVVSHVGYAEDIKLAKTVAGIDVIIGGHSNTLMSNTDPKASAPYPDIVRGPDNNQVVVAQAYAYSKYLGEVKVDFDNLGKVKNASGDLHLLDASVKPDALFAARLKGLAEPLNAEKNRIVAYTTTPIDGDRKRCRMMECEMGNLVADAMLDRVKNQGISIAIQNGGNLRASIDPGEITRGEILTVLPFQNTLSSFKLKGEDIIAALENGVSQVEYGKGGFPQVSGIRYAWDIDVGPFEGRIKKTQVMKNGKWVDINPEKIYGVVSNNFIRAGGDGYKVLAEKSLNVYDYGPNLADVLITYLKNHGNYKAYTDGRILQGASADSAMEKIKIFGKTKVNASGTTSEKYIVKAGDSLWKIAQKYYGNPEMWKKIKQANNVLDIYDLEIGKVLKFPK